MLLNEYYFISKPDTLKTFTPGGVKAGECTECGENQLVVGDAETRQTDVFAFFKLNNDTGVEMSRDGELMGDGLWNVDKSKRRSEEGILDDHDIQIP